MGMSDDLNPKAVPPPPPEVEPEAAAPAPPLPPEEPAKLALSKVAVYVVLGLVFGFLLKVVAC